MEILSSALFRVTRETPIEMPTEPFNETEPHECRLARAVRLEVQAGMSPIERGMLAAELGLNHQQEVFEVPVMMAPRDLLELTRSETPKSLGGHGDGRISG
jgi:polyphosphate kinase